MSVHPGASQRAARRAPAVAVLILAISTPSSRSSPPALPTDDWPRARPEDRGLDAEPLRRLTRELAEDRIPDLHSLLIVRHGYLVWEEYFDGWGPDRLHPLQSVTKSFTSALIGIAIGQGAIRSVDEKVLDFFPDTGAVRNLDDRKRRMTLEHLLTMRSGTDYNERSHDSPHDRLNSLRRGWDRFYLDLPMISEPGSTFQYDSGGVILMSSLLRARSGLHADAFAERYLFGPLGIARADWFRNDEGHPHTGGGLDLRPRDMARFGLLYLREGRWGDRQVVPADWVRRSTARQLERRHDAHGVGYGYLWWIHEPDPGGAGTRDIYAAQGFRGQYIFVVPEHDMVVVVTGGTRRYSDETRPIEFLYSHILPAVRAPRALELERP